MLFLHLNRYTFSYIYFLDEKKERESEKENSLIFFFS